MTELIGIVYQDIFQASHHVQKIINNAPAEKETHSYKQFQMGIMGDAFIWNIDHTIVMGLDGDITNLPFLQEKTGQESLPNCLFKAYQLWGIHFVRFLKGHFILIIFDQKKEKLFLVRDQIGIKPLYWYQDQYHFIFGTKIKSLLKTRLIPRNPSREAIAAYLFFGYFPQELTPFRNVSKLLPGHYLEIRADQSKSIYAYWSLSSCFTNPSPLHPHTLIKKFDTLFTNTIKLNPTSPAACLTNDKSSSLITALYLDKQGKLDHLIRLENEENTRFSYLNAPIKRIKGCQSLDLLGEFIWKLEEPIACPETYLLFSLSRQLDKALVSSFGSLELYNIDPRYQATKNDKAHDWTLLSKTLLKSLHFVFPSLALKLLKHQQSPSWQSHFLSKNAVFNEREIAEIAPELSQLFDAEVFILKFHHLHRLKNFKDAILYFDLKTRFPDLYAFSCEKLLTSWANPYFELSVIEFLVNVPEAERPLIASLLEQKFFHRLPPPLQTKFDAAILPSLDSIIPYLQQGYLVEEGLLSEKWFQNPQHLKNKEQLWSLLVLEIWYRLFINESTIEDPPIAELNFLVKKRKFYDKSA